MSHIDWKDNWLDKTEEFKYFSEKETKRWINLGFSKDEAKKWLEKWPFSENFSLKAFFCYFIKNIREINIEKFSKLKSTDSIVNDYNQWASDKCVCSYCQKLCNQEESYFHDSLNDSYFCSQDCHFNSENYGQEKLERWFPKNLKTYSFLVSLMINNQELTGAINFGHLSNLEQISCFKNKIESINLSKNERIKTINAENNILWEILLPKDNEIEVIKISNNNLTKFDYEILNPKTLTVFNVGDNALEKENIDLFIKFTNLKELIIGNHNHNKANKGLFNMFDGSLKKFIKNFEDNEIIIDISNTDVDLEISNYNGCLNCFYNLNPNLKFRNVSIIISQSLKIIIDKRKNEMIEEGIQSKKEIEKLEEENEDLWNKNEKLIDAKEMIEVWSEGYVEYNASVKFQEKLRKKNHFIKNFLNSTKLNEDEKKEIENIIFNDFDEVSQEIESL